MDFAQGWDKTDTAWMASAMTAIYADVQSTKDLIAKGGQETNPLYGTHYPSGAALDQGELIASSLTALAAAALTPEWRKIMLGAVTGVEATLALQNPHLDPHSKPRSFEEAITIPAIMGAIGAVAGKFSSDLSMSVLPTKGGVTLGAQWKF